MSYKKIIKESDVIANFGEDTLFLHSGSPTLSYHHREDKEKISVHWGQRKLLFAIVEFFVKYWDDIQNIINKGLIPQIVYAGAAPGDNINLLVKMFPQCQWHLYDPRPVWHIKASDKVKIYTQFFTNETAQAWSSLKGREDVIFLSDIRITTEAFEKTRAGVKGKLASNKDRALGSISMEEQVMKDNHMQEEWYQIIKPVKASLKFRLPYILEIGLITARVDTGSKIIPVDDVSFNIYHPGNSFGIKLVIDGQPILYLDKKVVGKNPATKTLTLSEGFDFIVDAKTKVLMPNVVKYTEYLSGVVEKGIWAPQTSTEGRLVPENYEFEGEVYDKIWWDNLHYESQHAWQNTIGRQHVHYHNIFSGEIQPYVGSELTNDWDSTAEAYVLYKYFEKIRTTIPSYNDIINMSNIITVYINLRQTFDTSSSLEEDLAIYLANYTPDKWAAIDQQSTRKLTTLTKLYINPKYIKEAVAVQASRRGKKEVDEIVDETADEDSSAPTVPTISEVEETPSIVNEFRLDVIHPVRSVYVKAETFIAAPPADYVPFITDRQFTGTVAIAPPEGFKDIMLL